MADSAVRELALFIFQLGCETAEIKRLQEELRERSKAAAFDAGFALGRETAEQDQAEAEKPEPDDMN